MSACIRPSYDETYWLGIVRLLLKGRGLYDGAIDNKSPVVYGLTWLLDVVPGPFQIARGIGVGALVAVTALLVATMLSRSGPRRSTILIVGITLALSSDFGLTTELAAVTAIAGGLVAARNSRWALCSMLLIAAASFDPRVIVLFPGVLLLLESRLRMRATLTVTAVTVVAVAVVLLVPDLEFGLVVMNLASRSTRGGWHPFEAAGSFLQTALPLTMLLLIALPRRPRAPGFAIAIGALLIGLTSVHPFPHYWTYLVILLPFFLADRRSHPITRKSFAVLVLTLAFVPAAVESVGAVGTQDGFWSQYGKVDRHISEDEQVIVISLRPHLGTMLAGQLLLRSPTIQYMTWPSPRQERYLAELPDLVANATTIIDSGEFETPAVQLAPEILPVVDVLMPYIDDFPCHEFVEGLVIRRRPEHCVAADLSTVPTSPAPA